MASMFDKRVNNKVNEQDQTADSINEHEKNYCIDFHGAAIIDADGNEIAITEEMVLGACQSLDEQWSITPYQQKQQS